MSTGYRTLLEGWTISSTADGVVWKESRLYEDSNIETVFSELPAINSAHSSMAGLYLSDRTLDSVESSNRSMITLTYSPKGAASNNIQSAQNDAGETWEWMMVAQMEHIMSVPQIDGEFPIREWSYGLGQGGDPAEAAKAGERSSDGRIRVNDGKVEGTEIYRPTGALRVSKEFEDTEDVSKTFRQSLYGFQAQINSGAWQDWDEQEILFLGSTIRLGSDKAAVDYHFLFGKKEDAATFQVLDNNYSSGDPISVDVGEVFPFQYVWQEPGTKTVMPNGTGTPETYTVDGFINIKIADIYKQFDFEELGLTGPDA